MFDWLRNKLRKTSPQNSNFRGNDDDDDDELPEELENIEKNSENQVKQAMLGMDDNNNNAKKKEAKKRRRIKKRRQKRKKKKLLKKKLVKYKKRMLEKYRISDPKILVLSSLGKQEGNYQELDQKCYIEPIGFCPGNYAEHFLPQCYSLDPSCCNPISFNPVSCNAMNFNPMSCCPHPYQH